MKENAQDEVKCERGEEDDEKNVTERQAGRRGGTGGAETGILGGQCPRHAQPVGAHIKGAVPSLIGANESDGRGVRVL